MTKFTLLVIAITAVFASCTKIDTTTVGQGLIPPIDGVNTLLADTFGISCENGIFNATGIFADSTTVLKADDNILGNLQNTATFGSTNASIYAQFHPSAGFTWRAHRDSIMAVNVGSTVQGFDSAILRLGIFTSATESGFYGDTTQDITFDVYRINTTANFKSDSAYKMLNNPNISDDGVVIGSVTLKPKDLRKYSIYYLKQTKDSLANQVRIQLNSTGEAWARNNWLYKDTISTGANGAFVTRAGFTALNNGFVIKARSNGNALIRVALANNAASRFEIWYKYRTAGTIDTARQFFYFNSTANDPWVSANANYINRNVSGAAVQTTTAAGNDNLIYIESTPGSYTKIKIPTMKNFPNKMIHRAELVFVEDAAFKDNNFYAPTRLMLDCFDSVASTPQKYLSVPYDYYVSGSQVDFSYFGGDRKLVTDPISGKNLATYTFNITKYFQYIITQNLPAYNFRLYAPFDTRTYSQSLGYYYSLGAGFDNTIWPLINPTTFGRVVLGNGSNPNYKMKLRVIYSNI